MSAFQALLQDEEGQAMTEYIIILSVAAIFAGRFGRALVDAFDRGVLYLGVELEKNLKTGRAPLGVWRN